MSKANVDSMLETMSDVNIFSMSRANVDSILKRILDIYTFSNIERLDFNIFTNTERQKLQKMADCNLFENIESSMLKQCFSTNQPPVNQISTLKLYFVPAVNTCFIYQST